MPSARFSGVNFIPDEVLQERRKVTQKKYGNKLSTALSVLLLLFGVGFFIYNRYQGEALKEVELQVEEHEQTIEDLKEFGIKGYGLGIRLDHAKKIIEEAYLYSNLLVQIESTTPENIIVDSYGVNLPKTVSLEGISFPNYTPIAEFQSNLLADSLKSTEDALFNGVKISSANLGGDLNSVDFSLIVTTNFETLREQIN